jgi:TDG/mug DNA glycosylase family protein
MVLPDLLESQLDVVFCGTAAGQRSAELRAYYAGRGNLFWATLHRVGLTPRKLDPHEYRDLLKFRLGLTDLAKAKAGSDTSLDRSDFDAETLRKHIARYRPRFVAFTSKRAAREFFGRDVPYGPVGDGSSTTRYFVLPSPSGAGRKFWNESPWRSLASEVKHVARGDA